MPDCARLVCSNGAYEYDRAKQKIVWANSFPASKSAIIERAILDRLPSASFAWESVTGIAYEPRFIEEAGGAHTLEQGGSHDVSSKAEILKLFVRTPEHRGGELARVIKDLPVSDVEVSSSGVPFVEITAAGVNKGAALSKVAADMGFSPQQTIAFGDNLNDVSMLQWAGESVAMGNAVPELHKLASSSTLSNAEDGVARFLEDWCAS